MASKFNQLTRLLQKPLFTDEQARLLLGGSKDSRYGILKRAIATGDLIHLRRGLYLLAPQLSRQPAHPFEIAQQIYGPSYVSLESALSYHQLIPETVHTVTSSTIKRAKAFETKVGTFSYSSFPNHNFYLEVKRVTQGDSIFFVASPWKAICDYVYTYKKEWEGLAPLTTSLRIEPEDLAKLSKASMTALSQYYNNRRVTRFLQSIYKEG